MNRLILATAAFLSGCATNPPEVASVVPPEAKSHFVDVAEWCTYRTTLAMAVLEDFKAGDRPEGLIEMFESDNKVVQLSDYELDSIKQDVQHIFNHKELWDEEVLRRTMDGRCPR